MGSGSRIEAMACRLEECYATSPFHSFRESLRGLREAEARWQPERFRGFPWSCGSILDIAFHVAGDKRVLMGHAFGPQPVTWDAVRAEFEAAGSDLAAARQMVDAGHELVLRTLRSLSDEDLDTTRPYYDGREFTAARIFAIIAEHDVYHSGQIHYIRGLQAGERASKTRTHR